MEFVIKMQIEAELDSTPHNALGCALQQMASDFLDEKLTARQAVVLIMEATHMLPGVYDTTMMAWRHRLQNLIYSAENKFSGFMSLQYKLKITANCPETSVSVSTQTMLANPNSDHKLEFTHATYELRWVLDKTSPWN